jgi:import inner membrane translocase subunit TIM50
MYATVAFGTLAVAGVGYLGQPREESLDDQGDIVTSSYADETPVLAYLHRARDRVIEKGWNYFALPSAKILLPDPLPAPYQRPLTLVLELEDTLVHTEWTPQHGWRTSKRPFLKAFLTRLCQHYEIVIYTSATAPYAQPILEKIDPEGCVLYRLFRDSTRYHDGDHVKDLDRLNRDLKSIVVVDKDERTYKEHPHNGIKLTKWTGEPDDRQLLDLMVFLEMLATSHVDDVRDVLKYYAGKDVIATFKQNQIKLREKNKPPTKQ